MCTNEGSRFIYRIWFVFRSLFHLSDQYVNLRKANLMVFPSYIASISSNPIYPFTYTDHIINWFINKSMKH